jgi:hypothetical protein
MPGWCCPDGIHAYARRCDERWMACELMAIHINPAE